jgi:membrane-bound lytic murein transglycosylase B
MVDGSHTTIAPPVSPPPHRRWRRLIAACVVCLVVVFLDVWLAHAHTGTDPMVSSPVVTAASPGPRTDATAAPVPSLRPSAAPATAAGVADAWVSAVAARTRIPARAVRAYANAQLVAAVQQPGCHVSWAMLAGIGAVESGHGTAGGSVLSADGVTSITILGPALDGTHGNAAIAATPAGIRLDRDPRWDHAVGPMQFIPSTWTRWATSADGAVANPNDIDDAALTAARYLCAAGGDLSTAPGWQAALAAYNAPSAYATAVTDLANTYVHETQPG